MTDQRKTNMKIIDLSHTLHPQMPVFPGDEPPAFDPMASIETNGYQEYKITSSGHVGTHIDAPAHVYKNGTSIADLPLDRFYGTATIIDLERTGSRHIEIEMLKEYESRINDCDFVLLKTGWSKNWGSDSYFSNFPVLSEKAAGWLVEKNIKGVGIDAISVDEIDSTTLTVHKILLEKGTIIIENLTNLNYIKQEIFTFSCLPLKIQNGDGSPTRAIAILKD